MEGRGTLRSISLALNWRKLKHESPVERKGGAWGQQERLCFLIRRKGNRATCEGPSLTQPGGDPHQQLLSSSTTGLALQECPGSAGGCGLGLGSMPRWLDRGCPGHKPRAESGKNLTCSARLPRFPITVFGVKTDQVTMATWNLGPPGTRPLLPPEGSPGSSASTSCPKVPPAVSSLIQAVSARRTGILQAEHLSWSPCFAFC